LGVVTGATVYRDKWETPVGIEDALGGRVDGCPELQYAYSLELLPDAQSVSDTMWRYRSLLPLGEQPIQYPLAVGHTPLIASPRLRRESGLSRLWVKDETRGPTASNKDRATALVLEAGLRAGVKTVSAASTGNVAVSLSVGAAATGLKCVIFVPHHVNPAKMSLCLAVGATVVRVSAGYNAAYELSRWAAREYGWLDRNTGVNPLTLEAKKTVALEIWEQFGREFPDVVVTPVGDGPTLCGLAKGFRELIACGASGRTPRIIGVQADGCQPVRLAWLGRITPAAVEPHTVADGIAVGNPISGEMVIRDVVASDGALVAVTDEEILEASRQLALAGVLAEPAGSAGYAGLRVALQEQRLSTDERVVVLVTGSLLKTPNFIREEGNSIEVDGSREALQAELTHLSLI